MKSKKKQIILLVFLVCLLLVINYPSLDRVLKTFLLDYETAKIDRIIDGDTIVSNKTSIRLLGINTPERGEKYYQEAKEFLEGLLLNKTVKLEFGKDKYDKYDRLLAYVFLDEENINLKLIEKGFANYYFYSGKDKYSNDLLDAWSFCIKKNINLCEKSEDKCSDCIELKPGNTLKNNCNFECNIYNWQIKGEGRKIFVFSEEILKGGKEILFELELTNTGDTLFLRDAEGGLVLWESWLLI